MIGIVFEMTSWERDLGTARGTRLGASAGSSELGCSVYELDPGGQATPYHLHHANEELLIVLEGELDFERPRAPMWKGRARLPRRVAGAHRLRNAAGAKARYLLVSTIRFPEVAEQLDTGTILAMTDPANGWAFAAGADSNYMELTAAAIQADPGS